jgi:hypothetical protein
MEGYMTSETYKVLEEAKIIRSYKCKKEEFEAADSILHVTENPDYDGYWLYEEIDNEDELKLLLMATEVRNTRSIRSMLLYFTTISVFGLLAWIIWLTTIAATK